MDNIVIVDTASSARTISAHFQYDRGLKLRFLNIPDSQECRFEIELCNVGDSAITHTIPFSGDDVTIPTELLSDGRDIQLFIFARGENWGKTVFDIILRIIRRPST